MLLFLLMLQRYRFNRNIFGRKLGRKLMFIEVVKITGDPRLWQEKAAYDKLIYVCLCLVLQAGILGFNLILLATSHLILTPSSVQVGLSSLGDLRVKTLPPCAVQ